MRHKSKIRRRQTYPKDRRIFADAVEITARAVFQGRTLLFAMRAHALIFAAEAAKPMVDWKNKGAADRDRAFQSTPHCAWTAMLRPQV